MLGTSECALETPPQPQEKIAHQEKIESQCVHGLGRRGPRRDTVTSAQRVLRGPAFYGISHGTPAAQRTWTGHIRKTMSGMHGWHTQCRSGGQGAAEPLAAAAHRLLRVAQVVAVRARLGARTARASGTLTFSSLRGNGPRLGARSQDGHLRDSDSEKVAP